MEVNDAPSSDKVTVTMLPVNGIQLEEYSAVVPCPVVKREVEVSSSEIPSCTF
jgi:hypothetical protein